MRGSRGRDRFEHRRAAVGHVSGFAHERRASRAASTRNCRARTATVQVDGPVSEPSTERGRLRKDFSTVAAELQRDGSSVTVRCKLAVEIVLVEQLRRLDELGRRDHLRVEMGVIGEQPKEVVPMTIRVTKHRRDSEGFMLHRAVQAIRGQYQHER